MPMTAMSASAVALLDRFRQVALKAIEGILQRAHLLDERRLYGTFGQSPAGFLLLQADSGVFIQRARCTHAAHALYCRFG